ncbi:hypothetical protein GCM10009716_23380 [Streptomyces sodiiphilus]|uniref:PASTA domain-containing protein n=1 Tax=Streptomyces sodiiphilus TaxID=226217 RepID=A0ABP5AIY6_9ACTN
MVSPEISTGTSSRRWPRRPVGAKRAAAGLAVLGLLLTGCGAADTRTEPAAATDSVRPAPEETAHNYVGMTYDEAGGAARRDGFLPVPVNVSGEAQARSWMESAWQVCFQEETAGTGENFMPVMEFGLAPEGSPCPEEAAPGITWPVFPDVTGVPYSEASERIGELGIEDISALSAHSDVENPADPGAWQVCFQSPATGARQAPYSERLRVRLYVAKPGTLCPQRNGGPMPVQPPPSSPSPSPEASEPEPSEGGGETNDGSPGGSSGGGASNGGSTSEGSSAEGADGGDPGQDWEDYYQENVRRGAPCHPPGAYGATSRGRMMQCTTSDTDPHYRWRPL